MEGFNRVEGKRDDKTETKQQEPSVQKNKNLHFDTSSSDSDFEFTCEVCNKTFSGLKPLRQHEKSAQHFKRIRKKEIEKKLVKKLEGPAANKEDLNQELFAVCKTCKKEFMGPESLEQHLNSSSHQKKMAASRLLKEIRDKDGHISFEKLKQKRKEVKSKMGIPIVVGKSSDHYSHSDALARGGEEGASGYSGPPISSDDSSADEAIFENQEFECLECKKVFTGVNPWYQHLVSKVHEKALKQKELLDKLKIAGTSLPNESSSDQYLEQEEDDVIFCRLCKVAFSGPESASSHLKSKKHTKNLELKKWKKAMKDNREDMKRSLKTKKKASIEYPVETSLEVRSKEQEKETPESKMDPHKDAEFSFRHDEYKSISEIKSSSKVGKGTFIDPLNATGDGSAELRKTDKLLENNHELQQELASTNTFINVGPEETIIPSKNNLLSFKETRI